MTAGFEENPVRVFVTGGLEDHPRHVQVEIENCGSYTFEPWDRLSAKRLLNWLLKIPSLLLCNFQQRRFAFWTSRRFARYQDLAGRFVQLARESALQMPLAQFQLYGEAEHLCAVLEHLVACRKIDQGRKEIYLPHSVRFREQARALPLARCAVNHALYLSDPDF